MNMYAKVYIDSNTAALDQVYDYLIPEQFRTIIKPAMRVVVPFGRSNKLCQAFVVALSEQSDYDRLKPIHDLVDLEPIVPDYMIDVASFLREQYFCTYAEAIRTILPSMDKMVRKLIYRYNEEMTLPIESLQQHEADAYRLLQEKKELTLSSIRNRLTLSTEECRNILASLLSFGLIKEIELFETLGSVPTEEWVDVADRSVSLGDYLHLIGTRAIKQREVFEYLYQHGKPILRSELIKKEFVSVAVLKRLIDESFVAVTAREIERLDKQDLHAQKDERIMNVDQRKAFEAFLAHIETSSKYLLFGVTGSGKTLVYFKMFEEMINRGKQCLLLVPEISLTPQMMRLVKERFPVHVAIMHSKLTQQERYLEFLKIKNGEAKIILGARSAIFMPFSDLGIIVVDEEHETSYKSSQSPRYDTIEVANMMAERLNATLVLSSATPSIESYHKAMLGEYQLMELPQRINDIPMPDVNIIDMRDELYHGNRTPISRLLQRSIKDCLKRGEQAVLFLNRRGYNTYVFCRDCGYIETCPNCEVSLTYHINDKTLSCHYCGYRRNVPDTCPTCGSKRIKFMGTGTEKIQQHVEKMFPEASVLRLDSDIARKKGVYESVLNQFAAKKADILIGTQMVVKGLDFEHVTLVGILLADTSLNFPDINAASRTFQLTAQAAGRAGRRSVQGNVVMQTYLPNNPTLVYSARHDYKGFYQYDIAHREKMCYPPFTEIMGIFTANTELEACIRDIESIYQKTSAMVENGGFDTVKLYQPAPAFIQKLKNKYIYHMLIRYEKGSDFKAYFRGQFNQLKLGVKSNMYVEINPITLL